MYFTKRVDTGYSSEKPSWDLASRVGRSRFEAQLYCPPGYLLRYPLTRRGLQHHFLTSPRGHLLRSWDLPFWSTLEMVEIWVSDHRMGDKFSLCVPLPLFLSLCLSDG